MNGDSKFNEPERLALAACLRVKADVASGEERLWRTIEAGRLLRAIPRKSGARTDLVKRVDEVVP